MILLTTFRKGDTEGKSLQVSAKTVIYNHRGSPELIANISHHPRTITLHQSSNPYEVDLGVSR